MREMIEFKPYLTGSVLNGNAGKYADGNLQLFTDNPKAVELFFIDRDIPYRATQGRLYSGDEWRTVPVFTISDDGVEIEITVLSPRDLRLPLRTSADLRGRACQFVVRQRPRLSGPLREVPLLRPDALPTGARGCPQAGSRESIRSARRL
jgi:hypothetical protein